MSSHPSNTQHTAHPFTSRLITSSKLYNCISSPAVSSSTTVTCLSNTFCRCTSCCFQTSTSLLCFPDSVIRYAPSQLSHLAPSNSSHVLLTPSRYSPNTF